MIPGLNSNLKHEDRMFHIQTEDSGPKYGHVISHLFHQGTILATVKKDYKHLLENHEGDSLKNEVLKLMRASHRQMVRRLISGDYNDALGIGVADAPEQSLSATTDPPEPSPDTSDTQRTDEEIRPEKSAAEVAEDAKESTPPVASEVPVEEAPEDDPHEDISGIPLAEVLAMVDEAVDNFGVVSGLPSIEEVAAFYDDLLRTPPPAPDLKNTVQGWFANHT